MMFSNYDSFEHVRTTCLRCQLCPLHESRTEVVFGAGNVDASILLIGQGPSLTDNETGLPYSGPAGELLDTALEQAGLSRHNLWITNIHKCLATRVNPKTNVEEQRPPKTSEVKACRYWLDEELHWIKPYVLVVIGGSAAKVMLGKDFKLSEQRGQWMEGPGQLPLLATYQPTYLKRLNEWDRPAAIKGWRELVYDLKQVRERAESSSSTLSSEESA
jgi:uracil-DNA glycosylase family 4